MMKMRTTVDIDPAVLERAKQLAVKERRTLGSVLSDALAAYLGTKRRPAKDPAFDLIVRGRTDARFPTPAEIAAIEEEEETAALGVSRGRGRAAS